MIGSQARRNIHHSCQKLHLTFPKATYAYRICIFTAMYLPRWLAIVVLALATTEPAYAAEPDDSTTRRLPASVMNGETYLYTDISLVNATDSLDRIMKLDLVK